MTLGMWLYLIGAGLLGELFRRMNDDPGPSWTSIDVVDTADFVPGQVVYMGDTALLVVKANGNMLTVKPLSWWRRLWQQLTGQ